MNFIIHELARVLSPDGRVYMVNDNVQYNGEEVPVDLILSDFAHGAGLEVERIWVLPKGKGNSSQQMGKFGRTEIRKCVYVWSKQNGLKKLERRIREDRLVEKAFDIIQVLEKPAVRETFFREIFHHALRLI